MLFCKRDDNILFCGGSGTATVLIFLFGGGVGQAFVISKSYANFNAISWGDVTLGLDLFPRNIETLGADE